MVIISVIRSCCDANRAHFMIRVVHESDAEMTRPSSRLRFGAQYFWRIGGCMIDKPSLTTLGVVICQRTGGLQSGLGGSLRKAWDDCFSLMYALLHPGSDPKLRSIHQGMSTYSYRSWWRRAKLGKLGHLSQNVATCYPLLARLNNNVVCSCSVIASSPVYLMLLDLAKHLYCV
jgi:hypothetical protein